MALWLKSLPCKPEDWSLDPQNLYKYQVDVATCLQFQPQKSGTRDPQMSLAKETSNAGELWIERLCYNK